MCYRILASIVTVCLTAAFCLAAPTTNADALAAAAGWLVGDDRPFGTEDSRTVKDVQTFYDDDGATLYHVVSLEPTGYVIVAPDDEIEPIIAFVAEGAYEHTDANPLSSLLRTDVLARVENLSQVDRSVTRIGAYRAKWDSLRTAPGRDRALSVAGCIETVADIRVPAFLKSKWSQSNVGQLPCYNYYTPNQYPCGCTATAMAQVMRYYQYPTGSIVDSQAGDVVLRPLYEITVDGEAKWASVRGGDGRGGPYRWDDMPLEPKETPLTSEQRQAIGALCYDAGVTVNMEYTANGSGAYLQSAARALRRDFRFRQSIYSELSGSMEITYFTTVDRNFVARVMAVAAGQLYWVDEGERDLNKGSIQDGGLKRTAILDRNCDARLFAVRNNDWYWVDPTNELFRGEIRDGALYPLECLDRNCEARLLGVTDQYLIWLDEGSAELHYGPKSGPFGNLGVLDENCIAQVLTADDNWVFWQDPCDYSIHIGEIRDEHLELRGWIKYGQRLRLLAVDYDRDMIYLVEQGSTELKRGVLEPRDDAAVSSSAERFRKMLLPSLNAQCPVLLASFQPISSSAHTYVADGYGYVGSTLYCHLNMGWHGSGDCWYYLADSDFMFPVFDECVYNIFTHGEYEIMSGRVTDQFGQAVGGITLEARQTLGGTASMVVDSMKTSETGVYAFIQAKPNTHYAIVIAPEDRVYCLNNPSVGGSLPRSDGPNPGSRYDMDLSVQLAEYTLEISKEGLGDVWVDDQRVSLPWTGRVPALRKVTLRAVPQGGSGAFYGWKGAIISQETTIEVTMDGPKSLQAYFQPSGSALSDFCQYEPFGAGFSPASIQAGQSFVLYFGGANCGMASISPGWRIRYYASLDTNITVSDYLLYETTAGFGIGAGQQMGFTEGFVFPSSVPVGQYYIGWIFDPANEVRESNENNNVGYIQTDRLTVIGGCTADFCQYDAPSQGFSPTTIQAGQSITITSGWANCGTTSIPSGWRIRYYASVDTTITSSDYLLQEAVVNTGASPGQQLSLTTALTFPSTVPAGQYYIGWIFDPGNLVCESNENNNVGYIQTHRLTVVGACTADFCQYDAPSQGFSPTTIQAGQSITITSGWANCGTTSIPSGWRIRYYASVDTTITSADYLLFDDTVSLGTAPGQQLTRSVTFTFPSSVPEGYYYIGWIFDPDNQICESNENNNAGYVKTGRLRVIGSGFEGCGVLVRLGGGEIGCTLFQADSGGYYHLDNLGGFHTGDRVYVKGSLITPCQTSYCGQEVRGCIAVIVISACSCGADFCQYEYASAGFSPSSIEAGQTLTLRFGGANCGTESIPAGWKVRYYASLNTSITESDYFLYEGVADFAVWPGWQSGLREDFIFP
ncbi:MAG: C10 family peptidase, partial [Sedimentisphaerales bacterium]|nr:C10 family peptidase [Sedimentisphaerales bacterium]